MTDIDYVSILTDLLCSAMQYVPHVKPEIGDWCYEITSSNNENRDCRIGRLKEVISDSEFITVTIGGQGIHWHNSKVIKMPDSLLRDVKQ